MPTDELYYDDLTLDKVREVINKTLGTENDLDVTANSIVDALLHANIRFREPLKRDNGLQ